MGGFVVGQQLNYGFPGTISRLADPIVTNRAVESADTYAINFGAPVALNQNNTFSAFGSVPTTTTAALTSGDAYTSISVAALPNSVQAGSTITLGSQTATLSADAYAGATTVSIVSLTASATYASGTAINIVNTFGQFAGIAVREVKQSTQYLTSATGDYTASQPCDVLQRGSVVVTVTEGTPYSGGPVYVVTYAGSGAISAVGNFVATSTPAGTGSTAVLISNAEWTTGQVDSNNVAELALTNRNKA